MCQTVLLVVTLVGCASGPTPRTDPTPLPRPAPTSDPAPAGADVLLPATAVAHPCPIVVPAGTPDVLRVEAPADVATIPSYAEVTASGIGSCVVRPGTGGVHPVPTSQVEVHYVGWTTDGVMFDSTIARDQPATFPLQHLIAGWVEGVGLMVEGEVRRLWIPESLAYRGAHGGPAGMLVFDIELLRIVPP